MTYHEFPPNISDKARVCGLGSVRIGWFSTVEDYVILDSGGNNNSSITIGARCKIKQGAVIRTYEGEIRIGDRVSVGEYTILAGHGGLTIGDCTLIAGQCYISAANHIFKDNQETRFQGETARGIHIGRNAWIGGGVLILDGVTVGEGCVIGAGSVVTRSLPDSFLCYGVPCKPRRRMGGSRLVGKTRK